MQYEENKKKLSIGVVECDVHIHSILMVPKFVELFAMPFCRSYLGLDRDFQPTRWAAMPFNFLESALSGDLSPTIHMPY
jgi:hypothetical protein